MSNKKADSTLPTSEYDALYDLYTSTNGVGWVWRNVSDKSVPWDFSVSDVNPCTASWQGIHCICILTKCQLSELVLDKHNISGSLPASIGDFPELQVLNLRHNNITGRLTPGIGNLTSLEFLDIGQNGLSGMLPVAMSGLSSLKIINLDANFLTSIPDAFYEMRQLTIVELGINFIEGSISPKIGNLTNLESFSGSQNFFTGKLPSTIRNCVSLKTIDISFNYFRGSIPLSFYQSLRNLETIFISSNGFSGTIPPEVNGLVALQGMFYNNNDFFGSLPSTVTELTQLQSFIVNTNLLTGTLSSGFSNLTNLQFFYVDENSFHGNNISLLFDNPNSAIISIFLSRNFLSGTWTNSSANLLTSCQVFNLQKNQFSGFIPWNSYNWSSMGVYGVENNYFTHTLPTESSDYETLVSLFYFVGEENYLTGTLPSNFLWNSPDLVFIEVQYNLLTSTIPPSYGSLYRHLTQLFLSYNFFTKSLPAELSELKTLISFAINNNDLTGTISPSFLNLPVLEQFYLQGNSFYGNINNFLNSSLQVHLSEVDISNNQFTGTLSAEFFTKSHFLTDFVASSNCLTGSIPEEICLNRNLVSLALDGLGTAENCRDFIFPQNSPIFGYFDAFTIDELIQGSIPSCLYELPALETLHLSGNGLTGTVPNNLMLATTFTYLCLSHNFLTGTVALELQMKTNWQELDLSYNKLTGELYSNLTIGPPEATLSFEVNRLSGNIPKNILNMVNISILNGNIFSCNYYGDGLPPHDSDFNNYSCGSNTVNALFYSWVAVLVFILISIVLVAIRKVYCRSVVSNSSENEEHTERRSLRSTIQGWYSRIGEWKSALRTSQYFHIRRLSSYFNEIRWRFFLITLFCVFVLLPLYAALKVYNPSYEVQYTWTVSAMLLTGETAAIGLFLALVAFICFVYLMIEGMKKEMNTQQKDNNNEIVKEELNSNDENIRGSSMPIYLLLFFINLLFMLIVDFSYVYIVITYNTVIVTLAALGLALFRIWTNYFVLWRAFPLVSALFSYCLQKGLCDIKGNSTPRNSLAVIRTPNDYSSYDISFIEKLILFNNIIIPGIAVVFILPDCFYNALFAAGDVSSSYTSQVCTQYLPELAIGFGCSNVFPSTTYSPHYLYSYQCSSKIIINYVSVYILMFLFVGIIIPAMKIGVKLFYDYLVELEKNTKNVEGGNTQKKTSFLKNLIWLVEKVLPEYFKPLAPAQSVSNDKGNENDCIHASPLSAVTSDLGNDNSSSSPSDVQGRTQKKFLFSKIQFTVQINSYLAILVTFGALFPLLAVTACLAIYCVTFYEELSLGRLITQARGLSASDQYEKQISEECSSVDESLYFTLWSTLAVACGLYSYILFDTMGDKYGWEQALPMTLIMIFFPLILFIIVVLIRNLIKIRSARTKEGFEQGEDANVLRGDSFSSEPDKIRLSTIQLVPARDSASNQNSNYENPLHKTLK
jgi:Leucine-rich repeat (LRR) protein/uncharacterized membrane protein